MNKNKGIPFSKIMEELKKTNPDEYEAIKQYSDIFANKAESYKKEINMPEFITPEEYYSWLKSTPEGKKHFKNLKKLEKESEAEFIKKHGGARQGAGRKKIYENRVKITREIPKETREILKNFAKNKGLTENEVLNKIILEYCGPDSNFANA